MPGDAVDVLAMGTEDASCDFKPMYLQRRAPGPRDVLIDVKYCGVCHEDLLMAAGHACVAPSVVYPCVQGKDTNE